MADMTNSIVDMIESSLEDDNDNESSIVSEIEETREQPTYTREDEHKARNQAMKQFKAQQLESSIKESKAKTKDMISELRSQNASQRAELEAIKAQLQAIRSNVDLHNDKITSDNIAEEERNLYQDPVIKNYYDVNKVREGYFNKAKNEGRYVSPREEWAIQNAQKLAEELERYKRKDAMRQEFMNLSLGGSSNQNMPTDDGFADVQNTDEAYLYGLKKLKEIM